MKLSRRFSKSDQFYLSLLGNKEHSFYQFENPVLGIDEKWENNVNRQQLGASFYYTKAWQKAGIFSAVLSYTNYTIDLSNGVEPPGRSEEVELIPHDSISRSTKILAKADPSKKGLCQRKILFSKTPME